MGKKAFRIDVEKCTGCMLCVIACKDEHVGNAYAPWTEPQPDTGQFWIDIVALERGQTPRVRMSYLPLLCQHCANAPCVKACPEGAIKTRDDGLVWIDPAACTNCGLCEKACPYGVIYMNAERGIAQKCTGCAHRVDEGALPRCAEVCPHDAIAFGEATGAAFADPTLETYHAEYQAEPIVRWTGLPKPWIAGTVIDPAGDEVIPGAEITATDLFANGTATVRSDAFGDFWLRGLEKDRKYRVEIKKDGYADFREIVTTDGDQDLGAVGLVRTP